MSAVTLMNAFHQDFRFGLEDCLKWWYRICRKSQLHINLECGISDPLLFIFTSDC